VVLVLFKNLILSYAFSMFQGNLLGLIDDLLLEFNLLYDLAGRFLLFFLSLDFSRRLVVAGASSGGAYSGSL